MISTINRYLSERKYLLVGAIVLLTLVTIGLTLMPADQILPARVWSYDKLGHLFMFGGWTLAVGYYRYITSPSTINLFSIFLIGILFGVLVEGLQYLLPIHRQADFFDIAYDALGCFIAVIMLYKIVQTDQ